MTSHLSPGESFLVRTTHSFRHHSCVVWTDRIPVPSSQFRTPKSLSVPSNLMSWLFTCRFMNHMPSLAEAEDA
jgi:hypothetical protein